MSNDENSSSETMGYESGHSSWSSESLSWWDEWPVDFDGTKLFQSLENDDPPIKFRFDVREVMKEVEELLGSKVVDIPQVGKGSNYFGMHFCLADARDVLVRISRCDFNSLGYAGATSDEITGMVEQQVLDVQFEAEIYRLLRPHREILTSDLLYYRAPLYTPNVKSSPPPHHTLGRTLFVFAKTEGAGHVWPDDTENRVTNSVLRTSSELAQCPLLQLRLLKQCARLRAALFSLALPMDFVISWLPRCPPSAKSMKTPIAPTRDFAIAFLTAKIEEMIPNEVRTVGWAEDHTVVGPHASRARKSLLRLVPLIMPMPPEGDHHDVSGFYRLVLDFGTHNMAVTDTAPPKLTSLYDWETAHIVPAILSDPQMATYVDLVMDADCVPAISRTWDGMKDEECVEYRGYAEHYYRTLTEQAPHYIRAIKAGKDARHIWFALKSWRGEDPEQYFDQLGSWADIRFREIGEVDRQGVA
ncbi:hypothetical protein B0H11DRAFT_1918200 [Mycena galericulata]|nr:hypothetical protein B0H11DRAFT_1918200 [Mycena galericulata]